LSVNLQVNICPIFLSFKVVDGVGLDLLDKSGNVGDCTVWVTNTGVWVWAKKNKDFGFNKDNSLESNDERNPPGGIPFRFPLTSIFFSVDAFVTRENTSRTK
jgi:hypothetical protein